MIKVKADAFCQFVEIGFRDFDAVFSDNFFDITSAEGVSVRVPRSSIPAWAEKGDVLRSLMIRSIADSYELPER